MSKFTWLKASLSAAARAGSPIRFGDLSRLAPASRSFGLERGTPIDRYYIEKFLNLNADAVRGHALEVGEVKYLNLSNVKVLTKSVLAPAAGIAKLSGEIDRMVIGDLTNSETLPTNEFDSFICTQTLNVIYDVKAAIRGAAQVLKTGGSFIGTVPGISQISRYDMDRWGDYWRFTTRSLATLLKEAFGESVTTQSFGNVAAAQALLQGVALEDMPDRSVLDHEDQDYQVIIGFNATKT